jgi:hypothetical protein
MFTNKRSALLKKGRRGPLPHGHGSVRHRLLLSRAREQAVFEFYQQALLLTPGH